MKYWTTLQKLMWLKRASGGSQEYSGDIVEFDTAKAKNLKNLIVNLSPIQAGSGDPSPENIRPITGRTGAGAYLGAEHDPDTATLYSVDWTDEAGTVYSGTVDIVTGEGLVTHGCKVFDGSETWAWSGNNNLAYTSVPNGIITDATTQRNKHTQNSTFQDKSWAGRNTVDGSLGMFYGASQIYVKYSMITSAEDAKTFFTNNHTTIVYELAEPIHFTVDLQQVLSLVGQNVVWSEDGPVTVRV